jgi:hypothetical protein
LGDEKGRPHHADVFVTVPRQNEDITLKSAFRRQRHALMTVVRRQFVSPDAFREGSLT